MLPVWKRFLIVRVPIVVLMILAIGQALAMALDHVPLRRSYMDDLALAVEHDHTPHRVVVLGDSITLMATRRFAMGRGGDDVANLATIAWTGAAAELFLLQRYLANHPAPQYVLYASAVDDLHNNDSAQLVHYYDWNVYTEPGERDFLRRFVPGIDAKEGAPAVLNVQENIVERVLSIARRAPPSMPPIGRAPNANIVTEPPTDNRMGVAVLQKRMRDTPMLGTLQAAVFSKICALSRQYGFQFGIVWPPLPPALAKKWAADGSVVSMTAQIEAIFSQGCNAGPIFDVNAVRPYTNFNRDGFHLHGDGWEERYAADLSHFIAMLPDRPTTAVVQSTSAAEGSPTHD